MDRILVSVLGFERRMGKHQIYVLKIAGRQVVRTLISHGVRDIGDDLMAVMARQMGITMSELKSIVEVAPPSSAVFHGEQNLAQDLAEAVSTRRTVTHSKIGRRAHFLVGSVHASSC